MNGKTCMEKAKGYVSRFMDRKTCALLGAAAVALAGEAYLMSGHEDSYFGIDALSQEQPACVELQKQLVPATLKINATEILGYKKPDDLGFYVITSDDKLTRLESIAFSVSMTPGKTPDGKDNYTATLDYSKAKPIWKAE